MGCLLISKNPCYKCNATFYSYCIVVDLFLSKQTTAKLKVNVRNANSIIKKSSSPFTIHTTKRVDTRPQKCKKCFVCESNTGPSDLQSDALPTELTKQTNDRPNSSFEKCRACSPSLSLRRLLRFVFFGFLHDNYFSTPPIRPLETNTNN